MSARLRNRKGRANGFSGCRRCGNTWDWANAHVTDYSPRNGCFPLCEACWQQLTPDERLPFYRELWRSWLCDAAGDGGKGYASDAELDELIAKWPLIAAAVVAGE